jgi:nucleotide-binding universal stress UspA family protein
MVRVSTSRYKHTCGASCRAVHVEDAMKVDRVLVPLDGSPLAEMAIPKALELLSDRPGATLILLRAVEATTLPGSDPTEAQVAVVHEAESYLVSVAARLSERGITRVVRSVWYSSAVKAIVEAARVRRVDVIVMSTHGRSGLRRVMRGSVAESVLRLTRTPILLVSAGGQLEASPGSGGVARKASGRAHSVLTSAGPLGPARRR